MSKEKELQDELEKYWGQLDRVEKMLRWIILDRCNNTIKEHYRKAFLSDKDLEGALWKKPDISDILEGK